MNALHIVVRGAPAPAGSKRHVGRGILVESSARVRPWRDAVRLATVAAMDETPDWDPNAAVTLTVTYYLARPASHYGTGRNASTLRASAPPYPAWRPDIDKLLRSTLDAVADAGAVVNDGRIVRLVAMKRWADRMPPGAVLDLETA